MEFQRWELWVVDDFPHEDGRWRELVGVQENDGASVEGLPHKRMFQLETWQWVDIWKATGWADGDACGCSVSKRHQLVKHNLVQAEVPGERARHRHV